MKTAFKKSLAKVIVSAIIAPAILVNPGPVYAKSPLVWSSMDVVETPKHTQVTSPLSGTSQDMLLNTIATMQQQQQALTVLVNKALQPQGDNSLLVMLHQQQQQQMQLINNLMLMIASLQQNRPEPVVNKVDKEPLVIEAKVTKKEPIIENPVVEFSPIVETVSTEKYVPYQRARLAPPDEPATSKTSAEFIAEAVQDGALEGYYKDSMAVFNYRDGALYKIYCKEGYLTDIRLQPGETVSSINGGDTSRWTVDHTVSGSGATAQPHILIKPMRAGVDTNLIITTNKHTYQIQAKSTSWYNPTVSWTYPQEERSRLLKIDEKIAKEERETIPVQGANLEQFNFSYRVSTRGDVDSSWFPKTVFDDGRKVYIKMTDAMKYGDAPALIIKDSKGKAVLVNYRLKNGYYIVDRLFKEAELRLGTNDYVRIKRTGQLPEEE